MEEEKWRGEVMVVVCWGGGWTSQILFEGHVMLASLTGC